MTGHHAMTLVVSALNMWLTVTGAGYQIDAADIVMTRRNGYTILALREKRPAARPGKPYSTMESMK